MSKYVNSQPHSKYIQYTLPATPSNDFLLYVNQYHRQQTLSVEGIRTDKIPFFSELVTNLYHIVFVTATEHTETGFGSGNYQLIKLNRDGGTYNLEMYGIKVPRLVFQINDASIQYTNNSITFSSNNGYSLTITKSGDIYDFTDNTAELWQITLNNKKYPTFRYQAVSLTM